ncbi:hypothetical protein CHI95_23135 [Providencia rettgeri]|uniref:Uncharacterized protein n=1 Tax=Providencia rettgeri TaxID=587 RepID=A0A264VLG7_PRORE|nr:GDSL-type esterase/lipase family protein [Providencia rettgeri]ELR5252246.1 hypothetical protein [Providencia rettgeri]OZS72198.1 hypothetical protein CHI95_23135 [Providencia rettgeri]
MMKSVLMFMLYLPVFAFAKPLFIGDSLTYSLATSAKKYLPVEGIYKESTGLTDRSAVKWNEYVQTISFQDYETVVISLGANDGIGESQIVGYRHKATQFIRRIQQDNPSASVVWVLPPAMKNTVMENALKYTREAIRQAAEETRISLFDPKVALGEGYAREIRGVQVRTEDGIHYTHKGSDLIIRALMGQ